MLAGETSIDGGQLAFAKDVRVALHDQRPPRDRDLSLRDYVLQRLRRPARAGGAARRARAARWPRARPTPATLDAYARAQARLEHAGGYTWREGVNATLHGLGFRDEHLDRDARHVLRRRADARVARPRARGRPRPAAARRADEPPRHRLARVARGLPADRSTPPSCSSPTTAGSSRRSAPRCSSSRAAAARFFKGTWHAWRGRRRRASSRSAARSRSRRPRSRALERFVDRFRAGTRARQAQSRAKKLDKIERLHARPARRQGARLRLQAAGALGPRGLRARGRRRCGSATRVLLRRRRAVARARRARLARRPERLGQDDAHPRAGRRARARRRQAAPRPQRQARAALPARRGARRDRARCSRRASGRRGSSRTRRARCSAASCSAARRPRSRSTACRAASAGGSRSPCSCSRAPTCSSSTSRRTTSTSRAARRSRRRCRPSRARSCSSPTTARCSTRSGTRTVAIEDGTLHSYVGGWPEYVRVREERAELERDGQARAKAAKPAPTEAAPPRRAERAVEEPAAPGRAARGARSSAAEAELAPLEEELADPQAWNDPRSAQKSTQAPRGREGARRGALRELEAVAG